MKTANPFADIDPAVLRQMLEGNEKSLAMAGTAPAALFSPLGAIRGAGAAPEGEEGQGAVRGGLDFLGGVAGAAGGSVLGSRGGAELGSHLGRSRMGRTGVVPGMIMGNILGGGLGAGLGAAAGYRGTDSLLSGLGLGGKPQMGPSEEGSEETPPKSPQE